MNPAMRQTANVPKRCGVRATPIDDHAYRENSKRREDQHRRAIITERIRAAPPKERFVEVDTDAEAARIAFEAHCRPKRSTRVASVASGMRRWRPAELNRRRSHARVKSLQRAQRPWSKSSTRRRCDNSADLRRCRRRSRRPQRAGLDADCIPHDRDEHKARFDVANDQKVCNAYLCEQREQKPRSRNVPRRRSNARYVNFTAGRRQRDRGCRDSRQGAGWRFDTVRHHRARWQRSSQPESPNETIGPHP